MNTKHILEGRTILNIQIASDKLALRFETDKGDVVAKVDGDCCSHTWIEEVEVLATLPCSVAAVEDLSLRKSECVDYDTIQFYGCKITTDKGDITIDYRNSSNGYYGGDLWWPKEDPEAYNHYYGGVYDQNVSTEQWVDLS